MRIILFGAPGAGKGTQAHLIEKEYDIPHLSTGELFRSEIKKETELGKKVKKLLDGGNLVPDETVVKIVKKELQKDPYQSGYILDGFPRTVPQAKAFDEFLKERNESLDAFIDLEVPEQELVNRILHRGEGRSDDTEENIKHRLEVYHKETQPVLNYYEKKGLVKKINGMGSVEEIFERIKDSLNVIVKS